MTASSKLSLILERESAHLLKTWMAELAASHGRRANLEVLTEQARELLSALQPAVQQGNLEEIQGPDWARVREILTEISRTQTKQGLSPTEVATLVFSIKRPLFQALEKETGNDPGALAKECLERYAPSGPSGSVHNRSGAEDSRRSYLKTAN